MNAVKCPVTSTTVAKALCSSRGVNVADTAIQYVSVKYGVRVPIKCTQGYKPNSVTSGNVLECNSDSKLKAARGVGCTMSEIFC